MQPLPPGDCQLRGEQDSPIFLPMYHAFHHLKNQVRIPAQYNDMINDMIHARLKQSLSQEEVAFRIGCDPTLVQKWETRKRIPSGFMLHCWLDVLGYDIAVIKRTM